MNRHLAIKISCFCVLELRNSPAITRIPRLESEHFNHNLFDPDLIRGSLAINTNLSARLTIDTIKDGPHAHVNLEALLNIIVGLMLGLLTLPSLYKQILSWIFIAGATMHAGMEFLGVFGFSWAGMLLGTGIGPVLILLGLFLMGVATFIDYKKSPTPI